jgi:hypothetical protein
MITVQIMQFILQRFPSTFSSLVTYRGFVILHQSILLSVQILL